MADFKQLIAELAGSSNKMAVWRELENCLRQERGIGTYLVADSMLKEAGLSGIPLKPVRMFFLRSATLEQVVPVLRVKSLMVGIRADIAMGGFNQYQQEVLAPDSPLYAHNPDIIVLAVGLADLAPELADDFLAVGEADVQEASGQVLATMRSTLTTIRSRTNATILVHNFEVPDSPANGVLDHQLPRGQAQIIRELNQGLAAICHSVPGAYVVDYDGLSSRQGKAKWRDARMFYMARAAINPQCLVSVADEYVRYLIPIAGLTRKCLVLDMDNTLWGGIIGEDGLGGIQLGSVYPGAAFVDFQKAVRNMYRRGVILALCSKNNPEDALEVVDTHPDMILRREHFASMRINWKDKASNLREIAQELNIGIDSLVFLDDNPVEIAQVREVVPEVVAYQLPKEPEKYAEFLVSLPFFEVLSLTEEDRRRGEEYRQQTLRRSLESSSSSMEEFYRKLEMRATISPVMELTMPRIAQLTQKTNQFNLTTRRYTEQYIQAQVASGNWHVFALELDDRFGRNGLVAVGILRPEGNDVWIDTLLMSCRVMSRTAEQTFVHKLAVEARRLGFTRLIGEYIPTAKNRVVENLYALLGFAPLQQEEGRTVWALDLTTMSLEPSPYIEVL